jgi:hypothetical protein
VPEPHHRRTPPTPSISDQGFAALRVAATLVHTVPGLRARLRDHHGVRATVARPPVDRAVGDGIGPVHLSPCAFRKAVIEAALLHDAGHALALLDLDADPAVDIGVPPDGRSWPGGIYRVPLEQRWLYAFATTLDAETCHEVGRPLVDASGPLPEIEALGMRGDAETGVTVLYAETATSSTPVDELRVRALLEELLACFTTEELVRDLHADAYR